MRCIGLAAFTVIAGAALHAVPARADILLGVAGPLTGANAYLGEQEQLGAEAAVADLNAAGGVLGQQLRLTILDDACDPGQAAAAAKSLAEAGVAAVVGHLCSGATLAAAPVYEAADIVMISPAATNPQVTEEGRPNVFRVCGRDDQQGAIAAEYLGSHWRDKKIAILHDGLTYGQGLAEQTKIQLNQRGVAEALYEGFEPGGSDYSDLVAKLQAADVAVAYLGSYHQETALLVREARDRGYDLQIVAGDALATDSFWQIAGPAGEGTRFTFLRDPRLYPEAAPIVERMQRQGFEPEGYTLYAYGAVQVWAQAATRAGSLATQAVIDALRANEFQTILGPISFDAKGDPKQQGFVWYVWRDGSYVPAN